MWFAHFILYYILILSFVIYSRGESSSIKNKLYLVAIAIPLITFSSLRYGKPSTDTRVYLSVFSEICQGADFLFFEPGFVLLLKCISYLTHDGHMMLLITNLIFFFLFFRFILNYSCCIWLSVFLFIGMEIFDQSMNLIRQLLALSIIVNSFNSLISKKYLKFGSIVFLAASFHHTAIVFLIAPFVNKIKLTKLNVYRYFAIIPFLMFSSSYILLFIMTKLHIYEQYMSSDSFGIVEQPKVACILHLMINILIFYFCYYFGKKGETPTNILMTKLLMCGGIFWAVSVNFSTIGRAALYFDAFSVVLIPNILFALKRKTNITIMLTAFLILFITKYFVIAYMRPEWFGIYPYEFYFNH